MMIMLMMTMMVIVIVALNADDDDDGDYDDDDGVGNTGISFLRSFSQQPETGTRLGLKKPLLFIVSGGSMLLGHDDNGSDI